MVIALILKKTSTKKHWRIYTPLLKILPTFADN